MNSKTRTSKEQRNVSSGMINLFFRNGKAFIEVQAEWFGDYRLLRDT